MFKQSTVHTFGNSILSATSNDSTVSLTSRPVFKLLHFSGVVNEKLRGTPSAPSWSESLLRACSSCSCRRKLGLQSDWVGRSAGVCRAFCCSRRSHSLDSCIPSPCELASNSCRTVWLFWPMQGGPRVACSWGFRIPSGGASRNTTGNCCFLTGRHFLSVPLMWPIEGFPLVDPSDLQWILNVVALDPAFGIGRLAESRVFSAAAIPPNTGLLAALAFSFTNLQMWWSLRLLQRDLGPPATHAASLILLLCAPNLVLASTASDVKRRQLV